MKDSTMTTTHGKTTQTAPLLTMASRLALAMALALPLWTSSPGPALANPFSPVVSVNDRVITQYELDQRKLFLQILNQPGDLEEMARTGLIDDRLRMAAAEQLKIKLTGDQVMAGMTEFAGRANLSAEEFVKIVNGMGLEVESFRDFVEAGLVWREVVRARYAGQVTITDAEIDRAIANFVPTVALKLSLSEIVLPATGADQSGALALARRLQSQIVTEEDFNAAARANGGGKTGWVRLSDVPEEARPILARQAAGSMSAPVAFADKIVIYWVSERGEDAVGKVGGTVLDYAQFLVPDTASAAAELAAIKTKVDTCNDLYGVAKGLPADRLIRQSQPQGDVGGDIGAVLATLDAGESSTQIRRDGWRVFLMLCSRGPSSELVPDRANIGEQLLNQRLSSLAEIYIEELRAEAIIVDK